MKDSNKFILELWTQHLDFVIQLVCSFQQDKRDFAAFQDLVLKLRTKQYFRFRISLKKMLNLSQLFCKHLICEIQSLPFQVALCSYTRKIIIKELSFIVLHLVTKQLEISLQNVSPLDIFLYILCCKYTVFIVDPVETTKFPVSLPVNCLIR